MKSRKKEPEMQKNCSPGDIAVIGMSGKFPMADNIEAFWENLKAGKDCIGDVPEARFQNWKSIFSDQKDEYGQFGYLESIDSFDAPFFGIAPGESRFIDPAQRLLLQTVYQAIERGGYGGSRLVNSDTGVFIACGDSGYSHLISRADYSQAAEIGNLPAVSAGRISHILDLRGPSLLIDTACSSSLAALHYASQSIKNGECSMVIVGAVNIHAYFDGKGAQADIEADDDHEGKTDSNAAPRRCRVFDNSANGTVNGEGVAALLLKPLYRALQDGDMIHAVIKGSAINHNGARTATISAQKPESLAEVIRQALEKARVNPETISYIEASGAGTIMGDPIEIKCISNAFSKYTNQKEYCAVGSVKANIGHLNHASGLASMIKVILALQHKQIPPLALFKTPNSYIDFRNSPVYIQTQLKNWELGKNNVRRAGISSFSVNGTNCHVVLEEAPPIQSTPGSYPERYNILTVSAKDPAALERRWQNLKEKLFKKTDEAFNDICFSANIGQGHYEYRAALVCKNKEDLLERLQEIDFSPDAANPPGVFHGSNSKLTFLPDSKAVFLFSGLKKGQEDLCRDFFQKGFAAAKYMEECSTYFELQQYPQVLIFAFQYALAKLWMDLGIKPAIVLGFGIGKYVSKVISGTLKLEEALEICASENIENSFNEKKFKQNIQQLYLKDQRVFIEIGPENRLGTITEEVLAGKPGFYLFHSYDQENKEKTLISNIAFLYSQGVSIDFSSLFYGKRVLLPPYPFNEDGYWVETPDISPAPRTEYLEPEGNTSDPPQVEQTLMEIWKNFFGIPQVGIDDNFFQLGGDSLKAMTVITEIHKALNIKIPLRIFFSNLTIAQLAQYINNTGKSEYSPIKPVEEKEFYPLSSAQKRLYFLQQMDLESTVYNLFQAAVLEGNLLGDRFQEAFRELTHRHESFRTSFHLVGDEPVQKTHHQVKFNIDYCKEESFNTPQPALQLGTAGGERTANLIKHFIRSFDLSQAPLLRVGVVKMEKDRHLFMVDMHHIISDGVSLAILVNDFMAFYAGEKLPRLRSRYKDYSEWQNQKKSRAALLKQENYWLKEFEGEIPILNLSTDFPRPVIQSFAGSIIYFEIGEEKTRALKMLALETKTTLYMVLISLYYVLLYKLSGQGDIIVGAPTAGRRHVEVNKIIGMFLNTLAIRNYPEGKKTFKTFLQEVKTRVTEAFENQDYQFEDLVERLKVRRDTSRNPLFDTMFLLQNQEESELDIPGLKLKPFDYQENSSKFDLSLYASESDQRIICVINYSTKLFKQATIEIVGQYLKNIQSAVLKNPSCQISDIEILSMEKKTLLLAQFNQGLEEEVKPMMADNKVFQDKLKESLFKFKDNAAIEYGENTITYARLDSRSDDAANWLLARGIRRETFIGILIEDRLELINIIVGIIKAGSVFIPLDSSYPDSRLKLMMKCSGMEMIISDETNYNRFTGAEADDFVLLDELFSKQKPARLVKTPEIQYYPEDKIYIYFTSGTTGTPKAVPGKNSGLLHFISWELERFHIRSGFRASQLIIPCFDPYLRDIFVPFCSGGVICIPESREILLNATRLIRWLDAQDIHLIHCVPGHFRLMNSAALTGNNFKNLKFILLSGEKINPPDLVDWYKTFGERIQIVNLYGPTETTLAKLHYLIDKDDINRLRIPIGTPIKGSRVIILDENFNLCGPLVKGEICIRTPFRSHGYYNDPGLNRKKFIQNPYNDDPADILYRSGDLGMVLADGNIDILGRIDRQVKLRGMRIELEEIESVLIKYPAVKEAVVVKKELSTNNEFLCAYVTEKNEHQLDKSMLNKYLAGKLPGNMVPSIIIQIEEITRNPNGKIDYKKLPDPTAEAKGLGREPKNHIEEKLLDLWSGILGRDKANINVTIGFFEAGGNSLNIMALVSKIHREFDIKIPLNEIFKNSTIESQAAIIMEAKKDKYIRFEPAEKKECYELSSAQKRMYVAQQMELGGKSYNIHNTVRLIGLLDRKRLEDTFLKLIQRHDILRTSFIMHHYRPVQKIYDAVDFEIEYSEAVENEVPEIIDHFIRIFDLSSPPLLRVGLVKTGENRHVMLVDMYHIISDAVSIGVLINDFTAQYKGEALPPLKIQYKDFVQWQYRLYKSGEIKKQEEYWLNVLKGELPVLNLPTDYPRPRVRSVEEGDLITFTLGRELTGKLFQVGKETNTTLFMLLLAVYFVFLFKYTGQEDIIVGSPITGRLHEDWQNVIGVFVNMLAMRNQLQEEKTFITLLEEVKRNALAAFENQDYQFEELVNHLRLQGKSNRNPLFDTEFAVHNMEMPPLEIPGLEFQPYESTIKFAKFDLHFTAEENNDNIDITLRYYTALFKKSTIDKMAEHFVEIVRQVVENLEIKLEDITISIDLLAVTTNILEEAKGDFEF